VYVLVLNGEVPLRKISLIYPGKCVTCGRWIPEGETAYWEKGRGVWHVDCYEARRETTHSWSGPARSQRAKPVVIAILVVVVVLAAGVAALPYFATNAAPPAQPAQTATSSFFQASVVPSTTELIPTTSQAAIVTTPTTQNVKWLPSTTKVIMWTDASKYVGQYVTVEGTIVFTKNSAGTIFLDFRMPYQGYFYAVIFSSASSSFHFSAVGFYLNKEVRITGNIQLYNGSPEIIVNSPSQIEVAYMGFNYP
jgi:hypothetical protein